MNPMNLAYVTANLLLEEAAAGLDLPVPEHIPLKLQGEAGRLVSGLPRVLANKAGEPPEGLAQRLAQELGEHALFEKAEAKNGLLYLPFSQSFYALVLKQRPAEDTPVPPLPDTREREDPAFLRAYTLRRCLELGGREPSGFIPALPPALLCLLAGDADERSVREALRRYWALEPEKRACPALCRSLAAFLSREK